MVSFVSTVSCHYSTTHSIFHIIMQYRGKTWIRLSTHKRHPIYSPSWVSCMATIVKICEKSYSIKMKLLCALYRKDCYKKLWIVVSKKSFLNHIFEIKSTCEHKMTCLIYEYSPFPISRTMKVATVNRKIWKYVTNRSYTVNNMWNWISIIFKSCYFNQHYIFLIGNVLDGCTRQHILQASCHKTKVICT